jgi:hypothetical protein
MKRGIESKNKEKMWYSIAEALAYLQIDESTLLRKLTFLNFDEPRKLPGLPGRYIAEKDVEELHAMLQPARTTTKDNAPKHEK